MIPLNQQCLLLFLMATVCDGQEPAPIEPEPPTVADNANRVDQLRAQLEASEMVAQIHGSLQQLSEAARIRQQLQDAISEDVYAHPGFEGSGELPASEPEQYETTRAPPAPEFPRFDLIKFLLGSVHRTGEIPDLAAGETVGAALPDATVPDQPVAVAADPLRDFIRTSLEDVLKLPGDSPTVAAGLTPDIIDSAFVANSGQVSAVSKNQLRESLELVSVTENANFTLGGNVNTWHSVQAHGKSHAIVGITDDSKVQLVLEQNGTYETVHEIPVNGPVLASVAFGTGVELSCYVVVAVPGELLFMLADSEQCTMQVVWRWTIVRRVTALLYFQLDGVDMLLVGGSLGDSSSNSSKNASSPHNSTIVYSADLYQFDAAKQHTWLTQKIPLDDELRVVQFMELSREFVLAFAQKDTVILMCNARGGVEPTAAHRFTHLKTIEAPHVGAALVCFQIGGLSYIAVGGMRPQILRYHRAEFYAQTILSSSWGLVEQIVAIPARTYRDDLIVLVQHRLRIEGGRASAVLEALIWNGLAFQTAAIAVPCWLHGVQIASGVSCVLDPERDAGIAGASVIQRGTNISLLVPREQAPSGLFTLTFRLDAVQYPSVGQTQFSHGDLLERMNQQTDVITEAETLLMNAVDTDSVLMNTVDTERVVTADWNVQHLVVDDMSVDDRQQLVYGQMMFGEVPWTEADEQVDIAEMLAEVEELQKELEKLEASLEAPAVSVTSAGNGQFTTASIHVLKRQRRAAEAKRTLNVEHLQVETINGVPVSDFVFVDDDGMADLGESDVYLEHDDVTVLEKVVVKDDSVAVGDAQHSDSQDVHIAGDVIIGQINGQNFNDIIRNIVLTNVPNVLDHIEVAGDVTFLGGLEISRLNDLAFPGEYLWSQIDDFNTVIITGEKQFAHKFGAIEMDLSGLLNGIDTYDIVTLRTNQALAGLTTFDDLQVTEVLNVSGRISGPNIDKILANPSILQTNYIQADCQFQQLIVNGPVYIDGVLQDINLDVILGDAVYRTANHTLITGFKTFDRLEAPEMQLSSALINNRQVDTFMTLNTPQTLQFDSLSGNIIFRNLKIDGLVDFVNVTELNENSVKLSGDQYTEAELVFEEGFEFVAEYVDVLGSMEDVDLKSLVPTDEPIEIAGDLVIDGAMITNLVMTGGQLLGSGLVNGVNLNTLEATRLSRSRNGLILAPFFVRNIRIDGDLEASTVNGQLVSDLQSKLNSAQSVPGLLSADTTLFSRLIIDGSVRFGQVNGHNFEVLLNSVVWLDRPNKVESILQLEQPIEVLGPVWTTNFNGEQFENFVSGIVRRDQLENLTFTGTQTFTNSPLGLVQVDVQNLGPIPATNILSRRTERVNNLSVIGNIFVDNLSAEKTLNGIDFNEISRLYIFDELNGAHVLRHPSVLFKSSAIAGSLWLHQSTPNVSEFLASVVRKNNTDDITIGGRKTFTGQVTVEGELKVEYYNSIHLSTVMKAMVFNENGTTAFVPGDVSFEDRLIANQVLINGDVTAPTIMSCDWTEWLQNGIRTDLPWTRAAALDFEAGALDADNIEATYLNEVAVEGLITLNSEQTFNGTTTFSSVLAMADVQVDGLVNGMNLRQELADTVTINGDQTISAPTNFQSIRVLNSLQTEGAIDGLDLQQMVPINEDIQLDGSFSFEALGANELRTDQMISGIDFKRWSQRTLVRNSSSPQTVTGNWTVDELHAGNVLRSSGFNGMDIQQLAESRQLLGATAASGQIQADVDRVCNEVRALVDRTHEFRYSFGHFEELLRLGRDMASLNSVHVFQFNGADFLLLNAGCATRVYKWLPKTGELRNVGDVATGAVAQWVMLVNVAKELHWATNSGPNSPNCTNITSGLNLWNFRGSQLELVKNIGSAGEYRLNEKQSTVTANLPETFYALQIQTNTVMEFDIFGSKVEEWKLPKSDSASDDQFVFLPPSINFDLALSDGSRLSRLTSTSNSTKTRSKRFFSNMNIWRPMAETPRMRPIKRERMESGGGLMGARNSTVPDAMLRMFAIDEDGKPKPWPKLCNMSWPKCKLAEALRNQNQGRSALQLGNPVKLFANKPEEDVGMALESSGMGDEEVLEQRMSEADANPEEVVMAEPPNLEADENQANDTLKAERLDSFGMIADKAEHYVDKAFNKIFGKPSHEQNVEQRKAGEPVLGKNITTLTTILNDTNVGEADPFVEDESEPTKRPSLLNRTITRIENEAKVLITEVREKLKDGSQIAADEDKDQLSDPIRGQLAATEDKGTTIAPSWFNRTITSIGKEAKVLMNEVNEKLHEGSQTSIDRSPEKLEATEESEPTIAPTLFNKTLTNIGNEAKHLIQEVKEKLQEGSQRTNDDDRDNTDMKTPLGATRLTNISDANSAHPIKPEVSLFDNYHNNSLHNGSISSNATSRADWFGHLEQNTKNLMDNIMDNRFGPPDNPNEPSYPVDEDDDDVSTAENASNDSQVGAALFGIPQELQVTNLPLSSIPANLTNTDPADGTSNSTDSDPQVGGILDVIRNVGFAMHRGHEIVQELRDDYNERHSQAQQTSHPNHQGHGHEVRHPDRHETNADVDRDVDGNTDEDPVERIDNNSDEDDDDEPVVGATAEQQTEGSPADGETEIGVAVQTIGGVATTDNQYLPGGRAGSEVIALDVGSSQKRRLLVGVSQWSDDTVKGHQDIIRIYEDIVDGRIFQTINCHRPRSLVTMRLGIDILLIFVERLAEVRVLVYRGIEGFVPMSAFTLPAPVLQLQTIALPARERHSCLRQMLVVQMAQEVRLLEAIGVGYCGMSSEALECARNATKD